MNEYGRITYLLSKSKTLLDKKGFHGHTKIYLTIYVKILKTENIYGQNIGRKTKTVGPGDARTYISTGN